MNFLELAGNLEREDDIEILEQPPIKSIAPKPPLDKGKGISGVPSKRKAGGAVAGTEKLMSDAQKTRLSKRLARAELNVAKEVKKGSLMSVGTNRAIGPE